MTLSDDIFKALEASSETAGDAVNNWTRQQMRCLTRRGLVGRSIFQRIMPMIPVPPDGIIPPWETGALLHEIIETLERRVEKESRMTARQIWYQLWHDVRFDRRRRATNSQYHPWVETYHFGMHVASRLLAQVRSLSPGGLDAAGSDPVPDRRRPPGGGAPLLAPPG